MQYLHKRSVYPRPTCLLAGVFALGLAVAQPHIHAASIPGIVKIRVEGHAPGDGPRARDAAEADAKRQALLIWIESFVGEVSEEDFAPILDRADGYAQSSRILELDHGPAGTRAVVEVYVREWPLRVDVAALLSMRLPSPVRVVLLIAEQGPVDAAPRFGAGGSSIEALAKSLRARGIVVVDPAGVRERYSKRELLTYLRGGHQSIAKFGRENAVDVVIAGNVIATTRLESQFGRILRARATVDLEVVSSVDAGLYDSTSTEAELSCLAAEEGARMAIEDAMYKARDAMAVAAVLAAARSSSGPPAFELRIENPRDWREVESVASRLRSLELVANVDVLRAQSGTGIIRFGYDGRMSALVEELSQPFPSGRRMEPQRVVGDNLLFRFTPQ